MLCGVDEDVDTGAILLCLLGDRLRVRHVKRNNLHAFDLAQAVQPWKWLPGISQSDKHNCRAGIGKGLGHGLADWRAPICDQNAAELRITCHLAQMRVISHVRRILLRQRHGDRRTTLVELEFKPHAGALHRIAMKMRNHDRAGVEPDGSHPPRRALAEVRIGRYSYGRFRDQRAAGIHVAEWDSRRQARRAGVAWGVNDGAAVETDLQREASLRRRRGEAMGGAAANSLWAERQSHPLERIFSFRTDERWGHAVLARMAAQDDRPRS